MENTNTFKEFFTQQLNSAQQEAVTPKQGALLVIAGAGSGKTRVITARIAHLIINENVEPSAIIALTFTNKAANEMKERIARFLGNPNNMPFIGTFHSYCLRLLKTHGQYLDHPFLSILDEDDRDKLLSGIIQRSGLNKRITAKQLSYQISQIKNQMQDPLTAAGGLDPKLLTDLYNAYEKEKRLSQSLDFDDLLIEGLNLFKKHPEFKQEFNNRCATFWSTNIRIPTLFSMNCSNKWLTQLHEQRASIPCAWLAMKINQFILGGAQPLQTS